MIDNRDKIEQFLHLRSKDESELRAICEGMQLDTDGSADDMIRRIVNTNPGTPQVNPALPQAISLRSRNNQGETIPQAVAAFRKWRKLIFDGRDNVKEFGLLNGEGKPYKQRMKYILCTQDAAVAIVRNQWYFPHDSQKDLLNLISSQPENFNFAIVRKHNKSGNSFLMLHCEPKALAA